MLRKLTAFCVLSATAWAQLPPSALNPGKAAQPQPARPLNPLNPPGALNPLNPLNPARPQPAPAAPVAPAPAAPTPPGFFGTPAAPATDEAPLTDFATAAPNALTAEEQAQGWKLLFDGTKLTGLKGVQRSDPLASGWKIASGELNLPKEIRDMDRMTGGDLITTETYYDFDFRFEWKATVSANGGVRYMLAQSLGQTPVGLEYQIIDDVHTPIGLKGGRLRRSGALDNILPVGENAQLRTADPLNRKGDPWNEGRIVVRGNHVEHWLNGDKVLEFDLGPQLRTLAEHNAEKNARFGPYFGSKMKTQLCLLDEGTEVAYRNLKIRALAPQAVAAPPGQRPVTPGVPGVSGTGVKPGVPDPFLIRPKR